MIEWVVDTAASYHAMPNKELFITYKAGDFGCVKMGNTASSNIAGIRDISIQTNVGYQLKLQDVRHVSYLHLNFCPELPWIKKASRISSVMVNGNSPKE